MKKVIFLYILWFLVHNYGFSQSKPDINQLAYAKQNLIEIEYGVPAREALIRFADEELGREPESVVNKTWVAGSGDPHDYISVGPYWWPDPKKPDGLPFVRKDGERNNEVIKQTDRHKLSRFINGVNTLSFAWYFTNDEKYARKAMDHIRVWFVNPETRMNPNLNYGQMIPGHDNGNGRPMGIIETYGFVRMTENLRLMEEANLLTTPESKAVRKWFNEFLDWLLTSKIGIEEKEATNNHGLAYDVQVTAIAQFTGRDDIAMEYIRNFPDERIFKQIEPDGSQPRELARTLALHYSVFNLNHMLDMCRLAQKTGVDLFSAKSSDDRSITKAIEFLLPWLGSKPEDFPYKQISSWDSTQNTLCWILRRAGQINKNPKYEDLFKRYQTSRESDMRWLLYPEIN